jgi:hypothetical protein
MHIINKILSILYRIKNSVVGVGLYYGFLTTFSVGPGIFLVLRAQVIENESEKRIAALTGFILGQFVLFVSIYYAPMNRPDNIIILLLPYLFFHFFWNNQKVPITNTMRRLSILLEFVTTFIFQLFNHFLLPSSVLARSVKIYMFRCNNKNKMLFVTSSFVGWLIGHILVMIFFMKLVEFILVWVRQNRFIQ